MYDPSSDPAGDVIDSLTDLPPSGPLPMYGGGIALPLLLIAYGVSCWHSGHKSLPGSRGSLDLHGANVTAATLVWASIGLFAHFHFFWGNSCRLAGVSGVGKNLAALGFIFGLGYVIVHVGVFGKA